MASAASISARPSSACPRWMRSRATRLRARASVRRSPTADAISIAARLASADASVSLTTDRSRPRSASARARRLDGGDEASSSFAARVASSAASFSKVSFASIARPRRISRPFLGGLLLAQGVQRLAPQTQSPLGITRQARGLGGEDAGALHRPPSTSASGGGHGVVQLDGAFEKPRSVDERSGGARGRAGRDRCPERQRQVVGRERMVDHLGSISVLERPSRTRGDSGVARPAEGRRRPPPATARGGTHSRCHPRPERGSARRAPRGSPPRRRPRDGRIAAATSAASSAADEPTSPRPSSASPSGSDATRASSSCLMPASRGMAPSRSRDASSSSVMNALPPPRLTISSTSSGAGASPRIASTWAALGARGEALELDPFDQRHANDLRDPRQERVAAVELVAAVRGNDRPGPAGVPDQIPDEVERRGVGPVEVFEDNHERTSPGGPPEHGPHRIEDAARDHRLRNRHRVVTPSRAPKLRGDAREVTGDPRREA